MGEPYVGEIRMFAGNFPPRGYAYTDGQLLAISQNDALFSLFGTIYGGDGRTTFGLPDLRGRVPIHWGSGPGLSVRRIGQRGGAEKVTLTTNQLPAHSHQPIGVDDTNPGVDPSGRVTGHPVNNIYRNPPNNMVALHEESISKYGGSQAHENMVPFLAIHFIVALVGIYPSRN